MNKEQWIKNVIVVSGGFDPVHKGHIRMFREADNLGAQVIVGLNSDEWLSTESSKALSLDIAGVDLLFDNGGYKICEVNSNPGFEGMETFTKKNIAEEIVQFIKMKIGV